MAVPTYDIVFVGHTYRDRICHAGKPPVVTVGGSLAYGSVAAARIGCHVAVVTKLAEADRPLLAGVEAAGVHCTVIRAPVTSEFEVIYPDEDTEHRTILQRHKAPPFHFDEIPATPCAALHLAGNAHGELSLDLIRRLKQSGRALSADMQGFVRQPDRAEHRIAFRDVHDKEAIVGALDRVKLDALEGAILTGESDPARAVVRVSEWGCPEVVLTQSDGVIGRFGGRTFFAPFSARSLAGRNGRGDTTFAGYLARRLTHPPEEALAFAAALVSIKLETPGVFAGTLDDVLARLARSPNARPL